MLRILLSLFVLLAAQNVFSQSWDDPEGEPMRVDRVFEPFFKGGQKTTGSLTDIPAGDSLEGDYIRDIVFYGGGEKVLFANAQTQNLSVLDWSSGALLADIALNGSPQDVEIWEPFAVVSLPFEEMTAVVDLSGDSVLAYLPTPGQPNEVRIDGNRQRAFVAAADSQKCYILDLNTLTVSGSIPGFASGIHKFAFITSNNRSDFEYFGFAVSPDGNYLIGPDTSGDGVALHNISTAQIDRTFPNMDPFFAVEVSDSGRALIVSSANPPVLYQLDLVTFAQDSVVLTGSSLFEGCSGFAIDASGSKAVVCLSSGITLVDFGSGTFSNLAQDLAYWIDASGDARYAVCGGYQTRVYDFQTGNVFGPLTGRIQSIGAASDSLNRCLGMDPLRREYGFAFDYSTAPFINEVGELTPGSEREGDAPYRVALDAQGSLVLAANQMSHSAGLYDVSSGTLDTLVGGFEQTPFACAVTPDGQYGIVGDYDEAELHIVDIQNQSTVAVLNCGNRPSIIRVTPDGQTAISANVQGNNLTFVSLGGVLSTVLGSVSVGTIGVSWTNQGIFSDLRITPDGSLALVAASFDDQLKIVDISSRTVVQSLTTGDFPTQIAIADDGQRAAVLNKNDGTFSLIELNGANSSVLGTFICGGNPTRIAFDPFHDRFMICSNDDQQVGYFDAQSGASVGTVNFAPDYRPIQAGVLPSGEDVYLLSNFTPGLDDLLRVGSQDYPLPAQPCFMDWASHANVVAVAMSGPDWVSIFKGDTLLNIAPRLENTALELAPNPTAGTLNVSIPEGYAEGTWEVLDLKGSLIHRGEIRGESLKKLSLQALPAGSYILRLQNLQNQVSKPFVKQ